MTDLRRLVGEHEHELIAMRRTLHAHPEPSGEEHHTTELIAERLAVEGLTPIVLDSGTGVVCDLPMNPTGDLVPRQVPVVAIRADIDALAMDDLTTTPHRSHTPGLAHACGHDVHATALLGAALALLDVRRSDPQDAIVRLIFEPAEEAVPGGAVEVVEAGWLDHVRSVYGVHCDPKLDVGTLGLRAGPLTSAADQFTLTLTGPGGHTARPRQTVDLVRWSARVADRLWDAVQERVDHPVTVVLGALHTGAAANVIPSSAVLRGSYRTADREAWSRGEEATRAALAELMLMPDIGEPPAWDLQYTRGLPPVVNDAATTELVRSVVARHLGADAAVGTVQSVGGDSFAWYTEKVPGTYVRLGTHDPANVGPRMDLHSATFDVDERAIAVGAVVLAGCALAALGSN